MESKYDSFLNIITVFRQKFSSYTISAMVKPCLYLAYESGEKISRKIMFFSNDNYKSVS